MKSAVYLDAFKILGCAAIVAAAYVSIDHINGEEAGSYANLAGIECDNNDHDFSAYTETNKCMRDSGEAVYITRVIGDDSY